MTDSISPDLLSAFPELDAAKKVIVGHIEGPLLVIAGPGSGKTFSLVLRTINLLLLGKASPAEIVLCTFTQKAALELRDRIASVARKVGYKGDLTSLRVGTIHALCNRLLVEYRHRTPLGNSFQTLDDLTQLLFLFDNFEEIFGTEAEPPYLARWGTKWKAIEKARAYFNKITEELVDSDLLERSGNPFLEGLGKAYTAYRTVLLSKNHIDFAHQQRLVHDLLQDSDTAKRIVSGIRFVLVDEYQDTNYIQEQILLRLSSRQENICVVGDEDQSLYRFRGATVRNILEFPTRVAGCREVELTTNYRSHERIIDAYDRWMATADWSNPSGRPFRFPKTIRPDPEAEYPDYPAVFSIWGRDDKDEASRFADLISFLKTSSVIADYSQVALLLHSVKLEHSGRYIAALDRHGIPAFCPRARTYFENQEIRLMVGCLALIFGYHGDGRGNLGSSALQALAEYVDECFVDLAQQCGAESTLARSVRRFAAEIQELQESESLDLRPADYFYRLLALDPFPGLLSNQNRARNLAILSQLLNTFQNYYHYNIVTFRNREFLRFHLFNSFFRLLHDGGINEYEDPDQPLPRGHVQVMTIHQAKGLEFPVVVVGSLDNNISSQKQIDRELQPFYHRSSFEPEKRITQFDRMRLHYVAFSRAEKVLVLTASNQPKDHFAPIWQGLPQWPYVQRDLLGAQNFHIKERVPVKKAFSFTGDLKVYETCPRQYEYFRSYDFTPSRSAVIFFGLLVHQTIEDIHRIVLDGRLDSLDETTIQEIFDRTFSFLTLADVRPIGEAARRSAFRQVLNYFRQNLDEMKHIVETEVDVSVEKDGYILTGKIDLLLAGNGTLELLDFKSSERPRNSPELLKSYERQLCTYAHILEERYGKRPERLLLYWTGEERKEDALMEFPYRPDLVAQAGRHFDEIVGKIQLRDFGVPQPPEAKICKECDLRRYCGAKGTISPKQAEE